MSETLGTACVQGGYRPGDGEPRQIPIYQSTTWKFDTSEHMGLPVSTWRRPATSTRASQTPRTTPWPAKIAELEGGTAGMLTSSGQAANFFAVFNIAGAGDHVVASSALYGGTYNLLAHTMRRMGARVHVRRARLHRRRSSEAAFRPNTKAVFGRDHRRTRRSPCSTSGASPRRRHAHGVPPRRGQHVPHAGAVPPHRVGSRHRDAFHHQVHGRPRRERGRRHRGLRPLRLDGARGQVPRPHPRPTKATTASCTPSASARKAPSSPRRRPSSCATSAPYSRRRTRFW